MAAPYEIAPKYFNDDTGEVSHLYGYSFHHSTAQTVFVYFQKSPTKTGEHIFPDPTSISRAIIFRNFVSPHGMADLNDIELDESISKRAKEQASYAISKRMPMTPPLSKQYFWWFEPSPKLSRYLHFFTPAYSSPLERPNLTELTSDQSEEIRARRELSIEVFTEISNRFDQGKERRKSKLANLKAENEKLEEEYEASLKRETRLREKKRKLDELVAVEQEKMGKEEEVINEERKKLADKKERNKKQEEAEAAARSLAVIEIGEGAVKRTKLTAGGGVGKEGMINVEGGSDRSGDAVIDPLQGVQRKTGLTNNQPKTQTTDTVRSQNVAATSSVATSSTVRAGARPVRGVKK